MGLPSKQEVAVCHRSFSLVLLLGSGNYFLVVIGRNAVFFLGGIVQRYNGILYYKLPFWVVAFLLTGWMIACFGYPYLWVIHKYTTLLGLLVFWQLLAYLSCSLNQLLLRLAPYSFFIYVTHLYLVKGLKVFLAHFFYANAAAALISYFVVPVIIVLMIIFIGMIWGKIAPRSFAFVTGGRG